ncbi:serine/threonine protein kinase [Candidatus Poribacteria bacterium]
MNATLAEGTILQDRYKVVSKITTAGQSIVYKVIDVKNAGQELALKEMLETLVPAEVKAQAREQFHQQARILGALSHPNLPRVIESFSNQGKDYLVMEFVHGATLEEFLHKTPTFLEEHQAIAWAVQLCDVLDYLHSQKEPIIFRDIKPANIMLNETDVIKLIDFGIARIFNPLKQTDTLKMGSLGYAPPEQYKGRGQTDEKADIYALGATMHHLLTKRDPQDEPPFSFFQAMPRDVRPDLSADVERAIMRAVEYDKNKRQSSASELKAELLACSSTTACPTCGWVNAGGTQTCVRDGARLAPLRPEPEKVQTLSHTPPQQIQVLPAPLVTPAPPNAPGQRGGIVLGFLWIYSVIAGLLLGIVSCPLIIAFSLIVGALKGIIIGGFVVGAGILISRALSDSYGIFTNAETWLLVGIGIACLSAIVSPMASLINAHNTLPLYEKCLYHNHGRYAAALGSAPVLLALAYLGIKYMGRTAPLITRYIDHLWNLLISYV